MEREDVFSITFDHIKLKRQQRIEVLVHLYLYRNLSIERFSDQYKIAVSDLKEYIQMLIQESVLRGFYRGDTFIVANFFKYPEVIHHAISDSEIVVLGILSVYRTIKISNIAGILQTSINKTLILLKGLIRNGLVIGSLNKHTFYTEWIWKPDRKKEITNEDKVLVGLCMMLRKADTKKVAKLLKYKPLQVLVNLMQLVVHGLVELEFIYKSSWITGTSVKVYIKRFFVKPKKVPLNSLDSITKSIIGTILLYRSITPSDIAYHNKMSNEEVLRELAVLTAEGTFQTIFTNNGKIEPAEIPDIKPTQTIEEASALSFFNYEALMGILSTTYQTTLNSLAFKLNREVYEVIDALINLTVEGFIKCKIRGRKVTVERLYQYSRAQEGSLERWEKIVLGMIIAKTIITTKDLQKALGIKKHFAYEKLYSFFGKGLIKGNIVGKTLIPEEIPIFPPLAQLEDFPIHYQEIYGYAISNKSIKVKTLMKLWNKSEVAAKNIIYELTGSGLLTVLEKRNTFYIQNFQSFLPVRTLKELGKEYITLINEIEKRLLRKYSKIKLKDLAETLNRDIVYIFKMICQLVGHGYYQGVITPRYFTVIGKLVVPAKKDICISCGHTLSSKNQPCPNCNAMPPNCTVCQGIIKPREEIYECPNCGNLTHKEHMEQWLKIKDECPICKTKLTKINLILKRA